VWHHTLLFVYRCLHSFGNTLSTPFLFWDDFTYRPLHNLDLWGTSQVLFNHSFSVQRPPLRQMFPIPQTDSATGGSDTTFVTSQTFLSPINGTPFFFLSNLRFFCSFFPEYLLLLPLFYCWQIPRDPAPPPRLRTPSLNEFSFDGKVRYSSWTSARHTFLANLHPPPPPNALSSCNLGEHPLLLSLLSRDPSVSRRYKDHHWD